MKEADKLVITYSSTSPIAFFKQAAQAKQAGFYVLRSTPWLLLLDLDTEAAWNTFRRVQSLAGPYFNLGDVYEWPSKSGLPHRHVAIILEQGMHDQNTRIALQAALGSDPVREILTLRRAAHGIENASRLFVPKESAHTAKQVSRRAQTSFSNKPANVDSGECPL